ncbi:hemerythrin domain-containing protein [Streptacidiphilus monticola]|jgi:hemerythrin superfamily protein|uniref:Hemerythrin domain-containing protein n=1 Tax=Streptacidiphilus monticola TaxID=2161674 RepID=A0ABW1G5I5_9ACTN
MIATDASTGPVGHGGDLVAELTADHRDAERLLEALRDAPPEDREELAARLTTTLVRHHLAEEVYLYPVLREHVRGGAARADKQLQQQSACAGCLRELDTTAQDFPRRLAALADVFCLHVVEEEQRLFPALRQELPEPMLRSLGATVRQAELTMSSLPAEMEHRAEHPPQMGEFLDDTRAETPKYWY